MSDTPITDAIAQIGTETGVDVSLSDTSTTDPTVTAAGAVPVGKGITVGGVVQWAKDRWRWAVGASWRPTR